MRVWTRAVYRFDDAGELRLVPDESAYFEYDGPAALCKGDDTAKQSEETQQQLQQQQIAYNSQLMQMFSTQFANQSNVLNYLQGKMQSTIDNPTGFTPQQLTSLRTSANDQLSKNYQDAQKTLNATTFAEGSRDLPSGVTDQLNASLLNSEATDKATAQNGITQADAAQAQTNYWNAVNTLSGVASQYNPQSYATAATDAANSATSAGNGVANLSNAYDNSKQSTLSGILGGVTSGVFGAAGNAGGFTKLFG